MTPDIHIAAAVILDAEQRMLVVRKRGTEMFMQPGGKIADGETAEDALLRELAEEIGARVDRDGLTPLGTFSDRAAHEDARVVAQVFGLNLTTAPRAEAEIAEVKWLSLEESETIPLAPLTRNAMIPLAKLRAQPSAPEH